MNFKLLSLMESKFSLKFSLRKDTKNNKHSTAAGSAVGFHLHLEKILAATAQTCRAHGIDQTSINWIMKMLLDRVVNSYLGSIRVNVYVRKSCRQGEIPPLLLYCRLKDSFIISKISLLTYTYYPLECSLPLSVILCIRPLNLVFSSQTNSKSG